MKLIKPLLIEEQMSLPHYLTVSDSALFASPIARRQRRADVSKSLLPYVHMLLDWLQSSNLCHVVVGSQAMMQVLSVDTQSIQNPAERLAFAPNDWDVWVLVSDEQTAARASADLCRFFKGRLLNEMRSDKAIRKKRIYTVANDAKCVVPLILKDIPYPARWTGIALGDKKRIVLDVQVLNLGEAFEEARFREAYIMQGMSYLNIEGCVTFMEIVKSKRKEKGYNVDEIRRKVLNSFLVRQQGKEKVATWFKALARTFDRVFGETDFGHRNKGAIGRLLLRSIEHMENGEAELGQCESNLIEATRPAMNATIAAIDEKLAILDLGRIFVTGGDAMRRFDSSIKASKDIDTKIYVRKGRHMHAAANLAIAECAKAVTMMIEKKGQILPANTVRMMGGCPLGLSYRARDADNMQFRLRYLPEERDGRPRLVSIDYRMRIRVGGMEFNHNIPVLDVVIQRAPGGHDPRQAGTRPPIAALDWLVDDIRATWESSSRAKQRVWAGKREKNQTRFESLKERMKAGRESREGQLGAINKDFLDYMRDEARVPVIPDYLDLFNWAERRKRYLDPLAKKSKKQKVPFSREKLDEWRQEMRVAV